MISKIKIKRSFYVTLLFTALACTIYLAHSLAFEVSKTSIGAEIKWQSTSETAYVNASGGPGESLSAVQAAMQTWTAVPSSAFSFVYGGTTSKTDSDYGNNDGQNIICFGPMGVNGTLAENTFWFYSSGQMVDSDIQFNTSYPYATDGNSSSYDVQSLATHEMGHSLSLGDLYGPSDVEKTMYGYGTRGDLSKRTLHQDDIDGVTYLYPGYSPQPPSVLTGSASSVSADSARLNGSVNPNGASTSYYFEYGTTVYYGLATSTGLGGSGTSYLSVSKEISGLSPGTIYHSRLVASNASGTSYGEDTTFTTPAPPSAVTGEATSFTSTSARLNGSVNPNGSDANYFFQYGPTAAYGSSTASLSAGEGTGYVSVSYDISGLSAGTLYHFRLAASNSAGTAYGEDMTFTTPAPPPLVRTSLATAIKFSSASGVTSSTAQLNGVVNPNGLATGYYFEIGLSPSFGLTTPSAQAGSASQDIEVSALVTGLIPRSTYYFRIVATSAAGTSYGEAVTFLTTEPRPMPWLKLLLLDDEKTGVSPSKPDPNDIPD